MRKLVFSAMAFAVVASSAAIAKWPDDSKYLRGAATRSTCNVFEIPMGWGIQTVTQSSIMVGCGTKYNIVDLRAFPIGAEVELCAGPPSPAGWAFVRQAGGNCTNLPGGGSMQRAIFVRRR